MEETLESTQPNSSVNLGRLGFTHTFAADFRRRLAAALERNAFTVLILGCGTAALTWRIRESIGSDSWYTLVAGRTIATSGLPHHDSLTVLTAGRPWVDQQWLAHLVLYGLWCAGRWPLALLSVIVSYVGTFAVLAATARRLGASDRSVAIVALLCFGAGAANTALRAQIPSYLLYGLITSLLLIDERHPSRRVFLVFPLLVVWANVHGSVVLGASLVTLRGVTLAASALRAHRPARSWLPRVGAFLLLPWLCTLASPYGLALPGYYRRVLDNPTLDNLVTEWAAGTVRNMPFFFVLLFAGLWLVGRTRGALTPFAQLAFLGTAIAGLFALRNVVWFAFLAAATLPLALDELWKPTNVPRRRRINLALVAVAIAVAGGEMATTAVRGRAWFEHAYPRAAARAVSDAVAANPKLRVFANDTYSDWLLFEDPDLKGKVAYDIRYELMTSGELLSIAAFGGEDGPDWARVANGYRLLVLDPTSDRGPIRTFERDRGTTVLFRDAQVVVLLRAATGAGSEALSTKGRWSRTRSSATVG
jgi:hypothetical protein